MFKRIAMTGTVAAALALSSAGAANATVGGGGNPPCTIKGGGNLGIVSFTAQIVSNSCRYEVRGFIESRYGVHGVDAYEWYYGGSIVGTGTSKATMDVTDFPVDWGFQYLTGDGQWITVGTGDNFVTVTTQA